MNIMCTFARTVDVDGDKYYNNSLLALSGKKGFPTTVSTRSHIHIQIPLTSYSAAPVTRATVYAVAAEYPKCILKDTPKLQ